MIRKWLWLLILLGLAGMAAACNAEKKNAGDQKAATFPAVTQTIEGGVTPLATSDTAGPGGEVITGEQPPAGIPPVEIPDGQVLDAPAPLSSLLLLDIAGQTGKVADLEGMMLETVDGQLIYLVASTHGPEPAREMLIPWGGFYIVSFPADTEAEGMHPAPTIWMTIDDERLAGAPDFDRSGIDSSGGLSGDWDAQARNYWSDDVPSLPITGGEGDDPARISLLIEGDLTGRIGYPAHDQDGNSLGVIEDMILEQRGRALYLLLHPTAGEGWIPVAWKAFVWSPKDQAFILQVHPEALENAPLLERGKLPDTTLPGWDGEWQQYWQKNGPGASSVLTPAPEASLHGILFSVLQRRLVTNREGQSLGQPADWVVDLNGKHQFAVILAETGFIPLPWRLLDWQPDDHVEMAQDRPVVESAPAYDSLEDLDSARNWQQVVASYWARYAEVDERTGLEEILLVRTGHLVGKPVEGPKGRRLGTVVDIILEPGDLPPYLVIDRETRVVPIPWIYFEYDSQEGRLSYLDDLDRIVEAPGFDNLEEIEMSVPGWDREIRAYWGLEQD